MDGRRTGLWLSQVAVAAGRVESGTGGQLVLGGQ
jgi:hypothetical protein